MSKQNMATPAKPKPAQKENLEDVIREGFPKFKGKELVRRLDAANRALAKALRAQRAKPARSAYR